jgi:hypothetical protein
MFTRYFVVGLLLTGASRALLGTVRVVPAPQYAEPSPQALVVAHNGSLGIVIGPPGAAKSERLQVAAAFLHRKLARIDPSLRMAVGAGNAAKAARVHIYLWDYGVDRRPGVTLNFLDRQALTDPNHYGQSYVIRMSDRNSLWVVGSTDEGVLLGTMTVLQLVRQHATGVEIDGVYIRDYPDFQYRASADWLLMAEVNRWALDWGRGIEGYKELCERNLDEALRYKINMVVFDGFGWGLKQRFNGYGQLMRSLNQYARVRGIHLLYGGYGARYALVDRGEYSGQAWRNRISYPNGPTYQCMGSDMGTCRANEQLNRLKAEELRKFVATVEPGALYIHHEDVSLNEFAPMWMKRCERCRKRWPNDSLTSATGAVGALSHLDSELIDAIDSIRNPDGYDASRDCVIILVSPGYGPDSVSSADWSKTLEFWRNYVLQLPHFSNIQICFGGSSTSFILPQEHGGQTWIRSFDSLMRRARRKVGAFVFFAGGAGNFYTDYPLTGTPVLNAMFRGAATMYNFSGDFYEKPMEIINAEYAWNTRADLFRDPRDHAEAMHLYLRYMYQQNEPSKLFDKGGLYQNVCNLLYGHTAGPIMAAYYQRSAPVPGHGLRGKTTRNLTGYLHPSYLPWTNARVYAVPEYWKDLLWDSHMWGEDIQPGRYAAAFGRLKIPAPELHTRLEQYWQIRAELNAEGAADIAKALRADPRHSSIQDLQFLAASFQVDQPLLEALVNFHRGMAAYLSSPRDVRSERADFQQALVEAKRCHSLAMQAFPKPIDPSGGEVGAIQAYSARLAKSVAEMLQ